ncbi:MAG: DEAD/DEAH box helicase family protein [Leptospira sp.]|nr:DEAD/DEAH box helicase family protein [Leptospira sp.]
MGTFSAGSIVEYRNRNWLVEPNASNMNGDGKSTAKNTQSTLRLKPLGSFLEDSIELDLELATELGKLYESEIPRASKFPEPDIDEFRDEENLRITFQAFRLLLRDGTAPFRSFGKIGITPRIYQLVPLLMALRQEIVRLFIADDVGVGKTIEAGLVARELLDRNIIDKIVVLTPPSLCDQWKKEMEEKFQISAEVVRSSTLSKLERALPPGEENIFSYYPFLVVSVDLMKAEKYKSFFLSSCANFVIADEVHSMAKPSGSSAGSLNHLRYDLLKKLAEKKDRHMLLLSATPHNGMADSFLSLLGLLDPKFAQLDMENLKPQEREELARHFIQRRRPDIIKWLGEDTPFPKRDESNLECAYEFKKEEKKLFQDVLEYAREIVKDAEGEEKQHRRRMKFYSALALLRSISSSPAQASLAFSSKISRMQDESGESNLPLQNEASVLDGENMLDDSGSFLLTENLDTKKLRSFQERSKELKGKSDSKLELLKDLVKNLAQDKKSPIVWCRYIQTAQYLGEELSKLKIGRTNIQVAVVTGGIGDEERKEKVLEVGELKGSGPIVLVATDCLSEGVNLQEHFDAIIHYDLPWNPNRMEQREGRVDRYGQKAKSIPIHILYGKNNPMDGAILQVLIRKVREIHKQLGIQVPIPLNSDAMLETILNSFLLKRDSQNDKQLLLFDEADPAYQAQKQFEEMLENAKDKEKVSRSRFAHHSDHPDSLDSELEIQKRETERIFGTPMDVEDFFYSFFKKYGTKGLPIKKVKSGVVEVKRSDLNAFLSKEDQITLKLPEIVRFSFVSPEPEGTIYLGRTNPILTQMAEKVVEKALHPQGQEDFSLGARLSAIRSKSVKERTMVNLYRFRFEKGGKLAEEPYFVIIRGVGSSIEVIYPPDSEEIFHSIESTGNAGDRNAVRKFLEQSLRSEAKVREYLLEKRKERTKELNERYMQHKNSLRLARGKWKEVGEIELFGSLVVYPDAN